MCSVLSRSVDNIHVCDVYIGYFDSRLVTAWKANIKMRFDAL
jgi:hypothetical protein